MIRPAAAFAALATIGLACSPAVVVTDPEPIPGPQPAQATTPPETSKAALFKKRLAAGLTPYIDGLGKHWGPAFSFSGLVVVSVGGEIIYSEARGFRDRAAKAPIDADTSFRVGSVTKQFTAAAILELEERGKLSTNDTVRKHLPDYPKVGDRITIHHLLTHTAGVPSYTSMKEAIDRADRAHTVSEMLALFADKPLDFEPGAEFAYSNSGYIVLGAIIEKVSGKSYGDFVAEALFAPAGLKATVFGDDPSRANRAVGYRIDDSESLIAARPIHMSFPYAAGGIRSTASDLIKWHAVLAGDKVLGEASRRKLYTPAKDDYAYGWKVGETSGRQVISHGGSIFGFDCAYVRVPEEDLVIVAWSNNESVGSDPIATAALAALGGETPTRPPETKPSPLETVNARRIAGGYVLSADSRGVLKAIGVDAKLIESVAAVFIRGDGAALYFDPIGQDRVRIHAEAADSDGFQSNFFAKRDRLRFEFSYTINQEGKRLANAASGLLVHQSGVEVKFGRDDRAAARLESEWKRKHPKQRRTKGR